ncbi:type II toxin-antitoxin system HicA family toxin [Enterovirga sp. CN4-39]|uniref:type II toxin-antitoxin system HicA family toxin n=1 Tax=Enterovirga sp. CN4-39 TaxID=3400910 RepID=UPI003BFC9654
MPPRDFDLDIREIRRRLEREGWRTTRAAGSHDVYKHPDSEDRIPVPRGRGDLPIGTARAIAMTAGWTNKERR